MKISNNTKTVLYAVLISISSALVTIFMYKWFSEKEYWNGKSPNYAKYANYYDAVFSGRAQRNFTSTAPTNFIDAASMVTPTVVNIRAFEGKVDAQTGEVNTSIGSGVIISPDGYIVTNHHVVDESNDIEVTLNDKRKFSAKIIGTDPSTDIALIKINAGELPSVVFGNSDSLRVGEWVLAIGNPFNLSSTVTAGIVSAKARNINILDDASSIESFIQTDAVVNSGNSGGALVNTNGELVGINSAIMTHSGNFEGYSFSIPVNLVQKVIKDLKEFGVIQRGYLGISIDNLTTDIAKYLNIKTLDGVYVRSVTRGGAAAEAGIQTEDVITKINNVEIKSTPELQEQVGRLRPGNSLEIDFIRDGQYKHTKVTLLNRSNSTALLNSRDEKILRKLGFELRDLHRDEIQKLGHRAVRVVSITNGSTIAGTNMDPGFIITKINNKSIDSVEEAIENFENAKGKVALEGVYDGYEGNYYYNFNK